MVRSHEGGARGGASEESVKEEESRSKMKRGWKKTNRGRPVRDRGRRCW